MTISSGRTIKSVTKCEKNVKNHDFEIELIELY